MAQRDEFHCAVHTDKTGRSRDEYLHVPPLVCSRSRTAPASRIIVDHLATVVFMTSADVTAPPPPHLQDPYIRLLAWTSPLLLFVLVFAHTVAIRHLLTAALLILLVLHGVRNRYLPIPQALHWPVFAWLAFTLLSCAWSVGMRQSANAWLDEAFFPLLMLGAFYTLGKAQGTEIRVQAALFAGMLALALISLAGHSVIAQDDPRAGAAYYYPGVGQASTFALFALPVFVVMVADRVRLKRYAGACGLAAVGFTGAVTLNRMFWASALLTLLIALAWRWHSNGKRAVLTFAVAGLLAASALLVTIAFRAELQSLPQEASLAEKITEHIETEPRPMLWSAWFARGLEQPWFGLGFGKRVPRDYYRQTSPDDPIMSHPFYGGHAHNLFLNVFVQTGLAGLAIYAWLIVALARAFNARRKSNVGLAWAGFALIGALLIKNSTDDFMRDAVAMYFYALAGWTLALAQVQRYDPPHPLPS
jgi:O-antigen ligase